METLRRLAVSLLLIVTLGSPLASRADTLDTLLDILISAGVVDPALRDARELISCLSTRPVEQSTRRPCKCHPYVRVTPTTMVPVFPAIREL